MHSLEVLTYSQALDQGAVEVGVFDRAFTGGAVWCAGQFGGENALAATAASWFVRRAVTEARYALYVDWAGSGQPYSKWLEELCTRSGRATRWHEILRQFPVLDGRLSRTATSVTKALLELGQRLSADRSLISNRFGIGEDEILKEVEIGLSDLHNEGRSVARLRFAGGQSVIYKPKPMAAEACFNAALNGALSGFGIVSLKVADLGVYGWVEDAGPARRLDQVSGVDDEDIGRAAGLFWLLNATDLHVENVLPEAGGVRCLDLETLFSAPWIDAPSAQRYWRAHSITETLLFDGSVFARSRIGNISGFDPTPSVGALANEIVFRVRDDRILAEAAPPAQRVKLPSAGSYDARSVSRGFRQATRGEARIPVREFIRSLPGDTVLRFVARETFFYARILERLRQPRFLRSVDEPAEDLRQLYRSIKSDGIPGQRLAGLVNDEIAQLLRGDIPYFTYRLDDVSLSFQPRPAVPCFANTPRKHALRKLEEAEESDVAEQIALIRIALGVGAPMVSRTIDSGHETTGEILLALASGISEQAFRPRNGPARWLTLRGDVTKSDLRVAVGDQSFFAGTAGILLGLQTAETTLGAFELSDILDQQSECWIPEVVTIGDDIPVTGFSGLAGSLFVATELARQAPGRWAHLKPWAIEQLERVPSAVKEDQVGDVIAGSAGLALILAQFASEDQALEAKASDALQAARRRIVELAEKEPEGILWRYGTGRDVLLGYAHGWAGMAAALLAGPASSEYDAILSSSLDRITAGVRRDGGLVEYRDGAREGKPLNFSWCNGAAGFLRGALANGLPLCPALESRIDTELQRVATAAGRLDEQRFCCGDMGLGDLLIDLSRVTNSAPLRQAAHRAVTASLRKAVTGMQATDRPPELAFPGLFQNLSGILYTGCRLQSPALISLSGQRLSDLDPDHPVLSRWS